LPLIDATESGTMLACINFFSHGGYFLGTKRIGPAFGSVLNEAGTKKDVF
jgi:hypothetical protein